MIIQIHNRKVSAEELSCKWGIGVEKAKTNLYVMTQMNVRSVILPLDKRYRTYILNHKLRMLSIKFYTETLFADDTFVQGNKRAHI